MRRRYVPAAILAGILVAFVAAPSAVAASGEWPHYGLAATIDPATARLAVDVTVDLPADRPGTAVEFDLGAGFALAESDPAAREVAAGAAGFAGINSSPAAAGTRRYRLDLPPGTRRFRLAYAGPVDRPPAASPEEYARSFAETPGIVGPAGIPRPVVQKLNESLITAMRSPEMRQRMSANGFEPWTSTPDEFASVIRADRDRWGPIVRASGAKVD